MGDTYDPWVEYDVNEPELARERLDRGADIIKTDRIGEFLGHEGGNP